jgi:hypothetical protein
MERSPLPIVDVVLSDMTGRIAEVLQFTPYFPFLATAKTATRLLKSLPVKLTCFRRLNGRTEA